MSGRTCVTTGTEAKYAGEAELVNQSQALQVIPVSRLSPNSFWHLSVGYGLRDIK